MAEIIKFNMRALGVDNAASSVLNEEETEMRRAVADLTAGL